MSEPGKQGGQEPPKGGQTDHDRLAAVEQEQQQQRGMLAQILERLPDPKAASGHGPKDSPPLPASSSPAEPADIGSQVRAELAKIQKQDADKAAAGKKAQTDADWKAGVDAWGAGASADLEKLKAERQPREPEKGLRGRVQRLLIGRD